MARTEEALAADRAGLIRRLLGELLGSEHPAVARTLHDLAVLCEGEGHALQARALWTEALSLLEAPDLSPEASASHGAAGPSGGRELVLEDSDMDATERS